MKLVKLKLATSVVVLGLFLHPTVGWSTRAYAALITGSVTAAPSNGTIEVDHHTYQVQANSSAAKVLSSLYVGEAVDMVLDGPPGTTPVVISIKQHSGT
jgi:hypothetical protein